jgi:hypothetical protein
VERSGIATELGFGRGGGRASFFSWAEPPAATSSALPRLTIAIRFLVDLIVNTLLIVRNYWLGDPELANVSATYLPYFGEFSTANLIRLHAPCVGPPWMIGFP